MRALVKEEPKPGLWLEEQPIPEISSDDVLVKVHKTRICGAMAGSPCGSGPQECD
jgi:threonine 3-dehydrogenase